MQCQAFDIADLSLPELALEFGGPVAGVEGLELREEKPLAGKILEDFECFPAKMDDGRH